MSKTNGSQLNINQFKFRNYSTTLDSTKQEDQNPSDRHLNKDKL